MPVSISVHISTCVARIVAVQPTSVLDIGVGFGLWGFLCREYLDVFSGRVQPNEWQTRIDGIELFEPYIQTHQRALYSNILIGDVRTLAKNIKPYDLIIAGDVIEHLDKDDAEDVLETLYEKANKALMVNIPLGSGWDHPEQYGNPGELHRSQWTAEDFAPYPHAADIYNVPCGQYGTFFCPKDCSVEQRLAGLVEAATFYEQHGDLQRSEKHLRRAASLGPGEPVVVMNLADLLIRRRQLDEAIRVLDQAASANPQFHQGRLFSAELLANRGHRREAIDRLLPLLAETQSDPEVRRQAEELAARLSE